MTTLAAVDLGAQSGRVAVGRLDAGRLSVSTVHRFPNEPVREGGRLRWDFPRLYDGVLDGLTAARRLAGPVDSVGVDSWGVDFGLLDAGGRLVENPVHYRDGRRAEAMERVLAEVPARELYERTGIQLMPINTVFELAAMAADGDPALAAADKLLLIPDLVHHRLGGPPVSELTNATTTQCFDSRARAWAGDILERLDVPTGLLPEVVEPGSRLGELAADVAARTGIDGAAIVAPATHDTGSAVAAIPFRRPGSVFISAGTWSLVGLELDAPRIDDRTYAANLTNEGGVAGTVRLLRNVTGLWLLHECRRAWALAGADYTYEQLVALAEAAPAFGAFVDPDDARFAAPDDMPGQIAAFCDQTGQERPDGPGAVARCILESLALRQAQTIELVRSATGADPAEVHIVGGGAQNEPLCRWTAAASGLPVLAGPVEATVVGNLLVQAIALGELGSIDEAREVVRASFEPVVHEPQDTSAWAEARGRFEAIATARPYAGVEA